MEAGLSRISNGAQKFAATAAQAATVGAPQLATAIGPPAAMPAMPDLSPFVGLPDMKPAAPPSAFGDGVAAATVPEVRLIIDVNPSPLFDVQTRRVTLDVMKENDRRAGMGGVGVQR
jgi:hypothetical protein